MERINLFYQGTNTIVLKKNGSTLLIDPYFSRLGIANLFRQIKTNPQRVAEGLRSAGAEEVCGVLLTHTHFDHALDAAEVIRQQGGILLGSDSSANLARGAGMSPEHYQAVSAGDPYLVEGFRIVFHHSKHIPFPLPMKWLLPEKGRIEEPLRTPSWFWDYRCGKVFAIQVDRLLVFGSAGYIPGAYDGLGIESVVFPIGGLEMKSFDYLRDLYSEVVLASGARRVLVSHWDNFFNSDISKLKFLGLAKKTFHRLESLADRHGQTINLLSVGKTYLI